jgi:hypothetical protein
MQSVTGKSHATRIVMVTLAVVLGIAAVGVEAGQTEGAESPQALVARLLAAAENNDFAEMAACLAPRDREEITVGMILMSSMTVAMSGGMAGMAEGFTEASGEDMNDKQKAEAEAKMKEAEAEAKKLQQKLEKIFETHGAEQWLDESDNSQPSLEGVDQIGLIRDLQRFMKEDLDSGDAQRPSPVPTGELKDLVIEGDHATGTIGGQGAQFLKIEGRWFVTIPDDGGKG